ncbi:MAG: transporter substrate-binding domain-containing protein [Proteobacteria bacterium]|nr:transporter substrate-binding domain-containing protein [Pseudomonadota bacterium]
MAGLIGGLVGVWVLRPVGGGEGHKESAYERVMRTGVLRCGYIVWAPYITKDPKTGEISGIWHDFTEEIGKVLNLKIVWAEEVTYGDIAASMQSGRVDAFCGGLWAVGERIRVIDFARPITFQPILPYVRTADHRFDHDLSLINSPQVKVSTIDGEAGELVAQEDFPKAQLASLPQLSPASDMFNQVVTGKADVFFANPGSMSTFLANNPGKVRALDVKPLRIFPEAYAVAYGQGDLREMLDKASRALIYQGIVDKIVQKYETPGAGFWRVAPDYIKPEE